MKLVTGACLFGTIGLTFAIIGVIVYRGLPSISWEFLYGDAHQPHDRRRHLAGDRRHVLADRTARRSSPYRSELPPASTLPSTRRQGSAPASIRLSIANMAGVPSIVYGLFGLALFVITCGSTSRSSQAP